jgi:hypothetical protein
MAKAGQDAISSSGPRRGAPSCLAVTGTAGRVSAAARRKLVPGRPYTLGMRARWGVVMGVAVAVALLAAAPARAQDACARACRHMNVVSEREFKKELAPKLAKAERERITRESKAKEPERLAKCTTRCRAGRFDPKCVLRAKATLEYVGCLTSGTGAAAAGPASGPAGKGRTGALAPAQREELFKALAAANVKGKPVAAPVRTKILKALDAVKSADRLSLLGAGLYEAGAGMYGADLLPAFKALYTMPEPQRRLGVLRDLTMPLAAIGCARPAAAAMALKPELQSGYLLGACPPAGAPRLIPLARGRAASTELLLLALVMEHRARAGGFGADPLHLRALDVLVQAR